MNGCMDFWNSLVCNCLNLLSIRYSETEMGKNELLLGGTPQITIKHQFLERNWRIIVSGSIFLTLRYLKKLK